LLCVPVFSFCSVEQEICEVGDDPVSLNPVSVLRRLSAQRRDIEDVLMQQLEREVQGFVSSEAEHALMLRLIALAKNFKRERDGARERIHRLCHQGKTQSLRERRVVEQGKSRMLEEDRKLRKKRCR